METRKVEQKRGFNIDAVARIFIYRTGETS